MKYKLLGKTGLKVSELCLGTMTFGEDWGWGSSKDESRRVLDAFTEEGGNFLDTANIYTNGTSEKMIGEFIAGRREQFVLATKYTLSDRPKDPNGGGNSRKSLVQSLEGSLKRLAVDYVDLYYVHAWDSLTPAEEVMRALEDVIHAGKALYAGISDAPAWVVSRMDTMAELRGWSGVAAVQAPYSLVERTPERELTPMAAELDMAVAAWSPLAGGVLTGKYRAGRARPANTRLSGGDDWSKVWVTDRNLEIAEGLCELADEIGHSPAQVALNWLRQRPQGVVIPIIGARSLAQIQDNLACVNFSLTDEEIARLDEISKIESGYPGSFYEVPTAHRLIYGETFDLIDNHRRRMAPAGQLVAQHA